MLRLFSVLLLWKTESITNQQAGREALVHLELLGWHGKVVH